MDYITRLKQEKTPKLNDIDLQEIAISFFEIYAENPFIVITNSQPFRELTFKSHLSHLHHLLGLHKLSNERYSKRAGKVMDNIRNGKITLADLKKDKNFHIIKDRILMIRLLFLISDKNINLRVCDPLQKSRAMDIGIIETNSTKHIVLGIGQDKNGDYYFKTLEIYKEVYKRSRKFKILDAFPMK